MLRPVVIERFGGLDLRGDPGEGAQAIDLLNVTLEPGRVRVRDGSEEAVAGLGAQAAGAFPFYRAAGLQLITAHAAEVFAHTAAGVLVASSGLLVGVQEQRGVTGAAIGTTTASFFYIHGATSSGPGEVVRWNGAAWALIATFPAAIRTLTTSPIDNRLVVGAANSKVSFSDPGAPETYGANNYVHLTPGDGEEINGGAAYNNQVFIFKRSKFFVFYGTSTDSTGNPVFNYRGIEAGVGMANHTPQAVCTGADGVYFLADDGIYRTTGGAPVKVSQALDPLFDGTTSTFWQGGTYSVAAGLGGRLTWLDGNLYAFLPSTGKIFVLDTQLGAWSVWSLSTAYGLTSLPASGTYGDRPRLLVSTAGGKMLRVKPGLTTDDGTAIVSRYRASFDSFGASERKRIRETIVEGIGSPSLQWSSDWGALGTADTLTLGTSPAVDTARQRRASRGRFFSFQVGASSGAWSVNRIQANVDGDVGEPHVAMTP